MRDYLLDTDVLIEVLRGNRKIIAILEKLYTQESLFFYSPITKAEIFHGIRKGEEEKTQQLFQNMQSLPITDTIGEKAGFYLKMFHKSHNLQLGDALIAATAYLSKAILFALNRKHYPMRDIKLWNGKI